MPYGYPSGYQLVTDIIDLVAINNGSPCVNDGYFKTELIAAGIHSDHAIDFARTLYEAFPPSIDYFLFHNPRFMDVGKLAIALAIIRHEDRFELFARDNARCWYHKIVNCIVNPKTGDVTKFFSIVTFNYDRSLPCFLHASLKSRFKLSDEEAAQRLAVIPIVHVYGHVGLLPWQQKSKPNDPVRGYGFKKEPNELRIAASGIHTIGGGGTDEPKRARQLLETSKNVFILGFGFQDDNCELLAMKPSGSVPRCVTHLGLSRGMLGILRQRYNLTHDDGEFPDQAWDVSTFLDSSARFLQAAGF